MIRKSLRRAAFSCGAVVCYVGTIGAASAQDTWSDWTEYGYGDQVEVYYRTANMFGDFRVQWRCVNSGGETKACEISQKEYSCFNGPIYLGDTAGSDERATLSSGRDYQFPSDFACRRLGATAVRVKSADVKIVD